MPEADWHKMRHVLRLGAGDQVAILPNDGRLLRCELDRTGAVVLEECTPRTEPDTRLTLWQALSRPEAIESVVRMGTEIGVARFVLFPSDRSVVRWDATKLEGRIARLRTIAREAAEVSFRLRLPEVESAGGLVDVPPDAWVLSEVEAVGKQLLNVPREDSMTLVVGPEGGWSPAESTRIGERAVTLGPRVLRVDTAACAAAALVLLGPDARGAL